MAKDKGRPIFDYGECIACGTCVLSCPFGCIEMTMMGVDRRYPNKPYPNLEHSGTCTGCQFCEQDCPVTCITMRVSVIA